MCVLSPYFVMFRVLRSLPKYAGEVNNYAIVFPREKDLRTRGYAGHGSIARAHRSCRDEGSGYAKRHHTCGTEAYAELNILYNNQ